MCVKKKGLELNSIDAHCIFYFVVFFFVVVCLLGLGLVSLFVELGVGFICCLESFFKTVAEMVVQEKFFS